MYKEKQIIRINDVLSQFHRQKCIIVKKNKKSYNTKPKGSQNENFSDRHRKR